jgi:hypothetical protein
MNKKYIAVVVSILALSCKEKMTDEEIYSIGQINCKKSAPFIGKLGFKPNASAFSTTEKRMKGLVLIEFPANKTDTLGYKMYQDSSWKKFGFLGSISIDEFGNMYTSPIPMVNTLDIPIDSMNRLYKVDANTGKMDILLRLPKANITASSVPFGILGNYYDCHAKKLYISSVSGSTMDNEAGTIYVIDLITNTIIDEYKGIDAMGLFVGGNTGKKMLYIGKARTSEIATLELDKEGKFTSNKLESVFSLDGLGPRGNDRAKKIRSDKLGNLIVNGLDFAFNLAAQSETPETIYKLVYDDVEEKWKFHSILH